MSVAAHDRTKPLYTPLGITALLGLAVVMAVAILAVGTKALWGLVGLIAFVLFFRDPSLGLYATTVLLLLSGSAGVLGAWLGDAVWRGERIDDGAAEGAVCCSVAASDGDASGVHVCCIGAAGDGDASMVGDDAVSSPPSTF